MKRFLYGIIYILCMGEFFFTDGYMTSEASLSKGLAKSGFTRDRTNEWRHENSGARVYMRKNSNRSNGKLECVVLSLPSAHTDSKFFKNVVDLINREYKPNISTQTIILSE